MYGLNTETSDIDTFGVFIGPSEWFLGTGIEKQQMIKSDKFYVDLIDHLLEKMFDISDIVNFLNADLGKDLFSWSATSYKIEVLMGGSYLMQRDRSV